MPQAAAGATSCCLSVHPTRGGAIDFGWIVLFLAGIRLAFGLSTWLGIVAALMYFAVLPFVFQPSLARMMGFRNLRDYLDTVDREKSA